MLHRWREVSYSTDVMDERVTRRSRTATAETPIARVLLHDEVVSRLRDMIVDGRLAAGGRISERALCASFGISRTPLREALKVLAAEGLVELLPNRGAMVRTVSAQEARDMLELMGGLESFAAPLACARGSESEIAAIARLHETMRRHFERGERHEYFALNQRIHSAIIGLAGNASLAQMHASLGARMRRIRYVGNDVPAQWEGAMRDHEEIMQALAARDGARLAAALARHLANTWERVATSLAPPVARAAGAKPPARRPAAHHAVSRRS